jgi:hypothetical protein
LAVLRLMTPNVVGLLPISETPNAVGLLPISERTHLGREVMESL